MQQKHRALALLITATMTLSAGCSLLPKEQDEEPPKLEAPVKSEKEIFTAKRGAIQEKVVLRAAMNPARMASLYFKQGGRIKDIYVNAGDQVQVGQPLAELETGELSYDIAAADIALQKAQLALADVKNRPHTENDVTSKELDVQLARLSLERLQARADQSRLVAPFSGQVTAVAKKSGDVAQSFEVMVQISDPSALSLEAEVSDADLSKLAVGQKVKLDFADLAGGGGTGTLVEMPDRTAPGPRKVKFTMTQPDPKAKLGMTGRVNVILQEKADALLLPNAGVRQFAGRTYVLLQTPQGRREVDVVTGIADETQTEIVKGLKEGDQVIGK